MNPESAEALEFNDREEIPFSELVELSGLLETEIRELVDYGTLEPVDPRARSWTFSVRWVVVARTACRLRDEFELEPHALSVVLGFAERIATLERELRELRARSSS